MVVETVGIDYSSRLLKAIDVGMLLQANARPQSIGAWRQVLAAGAWEVADGAAQSPQPATVAVRPLVKPEEKRATPVITVIETGADTTRSRRPVVLAGAVLLLVAAGAAGYWSLVPRSLNKSLPPAPAADGFPGPATGEPRYLSGDARRVMEEQAALERFDREQAVAKAAAEEEARQQALKDAAKEIEEQQTRARAESDAKANAEPGEAELRLTPRERQRLQVALTSLGFDVGGIDGTFGRRSREMIAGWQGKRGEVATGFVTAAQKTALLSEGATAIVRWEEGQQRAWVEEQRRAQQPSLQQQPPAQRRSGWRWPWE